MTTLITELGYVGLEVSNLAKWEQFATGVLGLTVNPGYTPTTRRLRMDSNDYRYLLVEGLADDLAFAGWQVANAANVDAFAKHLDQHKVKFTWATDDELAMRNVPRMLHFKDPSGIRHEIYCNPELSADRFVSPTVASHFVTGAGGMGHIVFGIKEHAKTLAFVQDVLGMSLSDNIYQEFAPGVEIHVSFFHVNERHHSIAFADLAGPKMLHHIMIEVEAMEDVGRARDRCLAMGLPVHMDIGQHPNDKMISFYGETPSGFLVEYGHGGVLVDDSTWQVVTYPKLSEWGHRPAPAPESMVAAHTPKDAPAQADTSAVSASGNWKVVIKTPMGNNDVTFELKQDGATVSGSIKGDKETNDITEGKANGNTFTWKSHVSLPMPMELQFTATIDGNNISGSAKSPLGSASFSGVRA